MSNLATPRKRRLRMTKAQLIDEIDTLEQRAASIEAANRSSAPMPAKTSKCQRAEQALRESEGPDLILMDLSQPDAWKIRPNGRIRTYSLM